MTSSPNPQQGNNSYSQGDHDLLIAISTQLQYLLAQVSTLTTSIRQADDKYNNISQQVALLQADIVPLKLLVAKIQEIEAVQSGTTAKNNIMWGIFGTVGVIGAGIISELIKHFTGI